MFLNGYGNNYNYYNRNQPLPPVEGNGFNYSYHNRGGEEDEIDLASLFGMVKRRSLMIIATTLALAIPPSVWILSQPPVYEGKVEILVESPNKTGGGTSSILQQFGISGGTSSTLDYESQIQVLKSPAILAPIVKSIQSKYPEIVLFPPADKKDKKKEALTEAVEIKRGGKNTSVLQISYKSDSKEKTIFVLQQIVQGYLQYQKEEHVKNLNRTINFTEEEIKKAQAELAKWELEAERFQKTRGLEFPPLKQEVLSKKLALLEEEREKVKIQLEELEKLSRQLQEKLQLTPQQANIVTRLNGQPDYAKLVSQIREIETQIALETTRFGAQHPTVGELTAKRNQLASLLKTEADKILQGNSGDLSLNFLLTTPQNLPAVQQFFDVNNQIQALKAKDKGIVEALARLNQNISSFSPNSTDYNRILRKLQIANERYIQLLASRDNLRVQLYTSLFPWQLLTPIDENIIKDVSKKHLLLAGVGVTSVLVSLFVALMAEALSTQFRSLEEIRNTINLPLLATVAYNKNLASLCHKKARKKGIISQQTIHEAFNLTLDNYCHLYTNISLLSADKPINSIVISAASPEEGKSTTAVGLAKAAALLGKKVLLVDTDMRAPSIHSYLGIDNHTGLSHLITDNLPVEEVIKPDPQQENLFVITSGTVPPNPTRLLASHKWHSLMAQLHSQFDFVIYDTPPLALFPDAKSIIPHTDGLVLVLGMGKASRPVIQQLLTDLQVAHITVLGMVVNGLKKEFNSSYGYYSYYGYYGYGHSHYATRRG